MKFKPLLQAALYDPKREYIETLGGMEKALRHSGLVLDREATLLNDKIAMVAAKSESEAHRWMELKGDRRGMVKLPSGCFIEIPTY